MNVFLPFSRPDIINYGTLRPSQHEANLNNAFNVAEERLGIAKLLDAEGCYHYFFLCDYCMHLRFKSFSVTWLVCLSFRIISLQMWTAHGQMRSPSWHMCQCIINILPKWRQKKQEEDVLQRCKTFKDFMILIKSIPYHSYSISCAWVLLLKQ